MVGNTLLYASAVACTCYTGPAHFFARARTPNQLARPRFYTYERANRGRYFAKCPLITIRWDVKRHNALRVMSVNSIVELTILK